MGDERLQPRREAFDLRSPIGQQRRRRHQQARLRSGAVLPLENQQQREHLNGLAEPHVVGQAGAQTEFREKVQPAHAHLLVGPQHAMQRIAGFDLRQALRAAQPLQGLGQPGAGDHLRPLGAVRGIGVVGNASGDVRAGEQPHGLAERQAVLLRRALHFAEALDGGLQALAIEFDPLPAHHCEAVRRRQQVADFGGGERFAIERDRPCGNRSSALCPNPDGAFPPTAPVTRGRGGRLPRHAAGMRTTTPAVSRSGTSRRSCKTSRGVQRSG